MISRRNFFIILIILGTVFFLFQFSQVIRHYENDYDHNEYRELEIPENKEWKNLEFSIDSPDMDLQGEDYVLFVGKRDTNEGSIVSQWTNYSKRNLLITDSVQKYDKGSFTLPEFLLIDSEYVDFKEDLQKIKSISESGVPVVFLNLPDVKTVKTVSGLKDFLGISFIKEEKITVEGIKLFSGFLLGGETIYQPKREKEEKRQDLDLEMPWYVTAGGTKTYMVGLLDEYFKDFEQKNEYIPAIVWRSSHNSSQVFCVNGDFMSETTGLGILSAIAYEMTDYQLYPIVNAQNTLVINYPLMTNENDEKFNEIYSRSIDSFQIDVAWPSLVALAEQNSLKYTCFMAPKYNYSYPADPQYTRYGNMLWLFKEEGTEVGYSLEHDPNTNLLSKLKVDKDYYDVIENRYDCTSAFMDLSDVDQLNEAIKNPYVKNVRTIACDENIDLPILSYLTDDITLQSLTSNTKNFTYSRDLMLKSIETALGYDNAKLNLSDVAWPESTDDQWENIYNDMASSLATYWRIFKVFDNTTLTESDQRVRTFLNLSCDYERSGDTISLHVDGTDGETCWFMLRTHGEKIESVEGADFVKVEKDAYILTINEDDVKINVKSTEKLH